MRNPEFPSLDHWDWRFIREAEGKAEWSKDPDRKVGCVIVRDHNPISQGYNGFPAKLEDSVYRLHDKDLKNLMVIHAEANAFLTAAKYGISLLGTTLYVTYHPCSQCAGGIINVGISRVVCPSPLNSSGRWVENAKLASDMLCEAKIPVIYYC